MPPITFKKKIAQVQQLIKSLKPVVIGYSGGVDSALIAKLATMEIGKEALIVISNSPSLPEREFNQAVSLAKKHSFHLKVIHTKEMEVDNYKKNPLNRCYFCKTELYLELKKNFSNSHQTILDGTNFDDLSDLRPGREAAKENGVRSLLAEVGLNKKEVRQAAKTLGLENWNKPAAACLSSRVPHFTAISSEKLSQVEKAEDVLLSMGIRQVRVRHHDEVARIEVEPEDFAIIIKHRQDIYDAFRKLGYLYVSLDIRGFRSGSLNGSTTT